VLCDILWCAYFQKYKLETEKIHHMDTVLNTSLTSHQATQNRPQQILHDTKSDALPKRWLTVTQHQDACLNLCGPIPCPSPCPKGATTIFLHPYPTKETWAWTAMKLNTRRASISKKIDQPKYSVLNLVCFIYPCKEHRQVSVHLLIHEDVVLCPMSILVFHYT
jgi:hypothetical protein